MGYYSPHIIIDLLDNWWEFFKGSEIHVYAEVYGPPLNEVLPDMRMSLKFGILKHGREMAMIQIEFMKTSRKMKFTVYPLTKCKTLEKKINALFADSASQSNPRANHDD